MKRIVMGIVWFFIFQISFGLMGGLFTGLGGMSKQQSIAVFDKFAPVILIVSLILALGGTITGKLPGTKNK